MRQTISESPNVSRQSLNIACDRPHENLGGLAVRLEVCVSFRDSANHKWICTTTAESLIEIVRNAWWIFHGPDWRGPKPTLDTMFKIASVDQPSARWEVRPRYFL
jgi:hypothetical protein